MKKLIDIFCVCLLMFFFQSCEKDVKKDCEINTYGTVNLTNQSGHPYDISIDGTFKVQLPDKTTAYKMNLPEGGGRVVSAENGSVRHEKSFDVEKCVEYDWQIP